MRPAFSRNATWAWFVIAASGLILRSDNLGVTSIVRALNLRPRCYELLLNFFHSYAWSVDSLMIRWQQWLKENEPGIVINHRRLFTGDHTKIPKDGRKIPAVKTLHQDSETGSKPSYFRGHHWGCIAMLTKAKDKGSCPNGTTLSRFSSGLGHSWISFRSTLHDTRFYSVWAICYTLVCDHT